VAQLEFPWLRSQADWQHGAVPAALAPVQRDLLWAQHLVFFFPLWLGDMPALLKAFLEQLARPGFAFKEATGTPQHQGPRRALGTGRRHHVHHLGRDAA